MVFSGMVFVKSSLKTSLLKFCDGKIHYEAFKLFNLSVAKSCGYLYIRKMIMYTYT